MEQESVITTACKWSFHAYLLAAAVTQLHRKMPFLSKNTQSKTGCYTRPLRFAFLIFSCYYSVPNHSFFAPACSTLYFTHRHVKI